VPEHHLGYDVVSHQVTDAIVGVPSVHHHRMYVVPKVNEEAVRSGGLHQVDHGGPRCAALDQFSNPVHRKIGYRLLVTGLEGSDSRDRRGEASYRERGHGLDNHVVDLGVGQGRWRRGVVVGLPRRLVRAFVVVMFGLPDVFWSCHACLAAIRCGRCS
jgi:hypothetical protein